MAMLFHMALRKVMESDISGEENARTVAFGLGSKWYEIDLTKEEEAHLAEMMRDYIKAGREAGKVLERSRKHVADMSPQERQKIRQWGKDNGFEVPTKGRVPKNVVMAYDKAHGIEREIPFT